MRSILILLILTLAGPAFATDGVLEINQTCAVQTGCFSSDTQGFPVFISASGSYRLTSNLVVPDGNTSAIMVGISSASIDLNGFEITRVGCEGSASCAQTSGVGVGIAEGTESGDFVPQLGTSVRNGTISGVGNYGIYLAGPQSVVSNMRVRWNGTVGIILAGGNSIISNNAVYQNGGNGIVAGDGDSVSGNSVSSNGTDGAGYGLFLGDSAYRDNVITNAVTALTGTVSGGVDAGGNVCNGSLTCP